MDMRNLEGYPVHWESHAVWRQLHGMSTDQVSDALIQWYGTDEYRATLPIYHASIIHQMLGGYVVGAAAADTVWWWLGAIGVFVLARSFVSIPAAYCAGILTCASPLAIGHVGWGGLHTASSLSLSVILAIAWQILHSDRLRLLPKILFYGACLFLSSITYTYQWFVAPFFVVVTTLPKVSRERLVASILGIGVFLALRLASYGILALGGLEVHAHINDPLRIMQDRLSGLSNSEGRWVVIASFFTDTFADVILGTVSSYHVAIVGSAALGLLFVRDARFGVSAVTAVALGFSFGAIYGVAWVLMTGYPFVYMLAAHGMAGASSALATRLPRIGHDARTSIVLLIGCISVAITLTNTDLVGDGTFAVGWWRWWYTPH
jgi:hypothetical protein